MRSGSRFIVIGVPGGKRAEAFDAALHRLGRGPALWIPWIELIERKIDLRRVVKTGDVIRFDSPGRCSATQRALLLLGGAENLPSPERGRIAWPSRWYAGFVLALTAVQEQLDDAPPHLRIGDPHDIATMFDKRATHAHLETAGVPVPPGLVVDSPDDVARCPWAALFLKLRHGSSGSGVVALRRNLRQGQISAVTTVETCGGSLYNTRRLRTLRNAAEVDFLIRSLVPHALHGERWVPKASITGGGFDLRLFVVAGRVRQVVVRTSATPITNLHLLNHRGSVEEARQTVGESAWRAAYDAAEAAMRTFPRSLHGGVDVAISTGGKPYVLEVNAFGDLLPGIVDERGEDTYTAQIRHVESIAAEAA